MSRIKLTKCIHCGQESSFAKAWHLWEEDDDEFFTMAMHCNACEKDFAKKFYIIEVTDQDLNPLEPQFLEALKLRKDLHKIQSKKK